MSKWKRKHIIHTALNTTVFLWVTAKGLSCLIRATAEIFLPSVTKFCHPNSPLPPSMLPNHPTVPQNTKTTNTSQHLLSPVSSRVVNDTSFWVFMCMQSHTQPFLGKQNTESHSNEHCPWSVCMFTTSVYAWNVCTRGLNMLHSTGKHILASRRLQASVQYQISRYGF